MKLTIVPPKTDTNNVHCSTSQNEPSKKDEEGGRNRMNKRNKNNKERKKKIKNRFKINRFLC